MSSSTAPWFAPKPMNSPEPLRWCPFPIEVLPESVRSFVNVSAKAIGCDPSFIALPLLAGLASAIGNTRRIRLKRSWTEPAILWGAIIGDSGTLKSPAQECALRPVRKRQHDAMRRHAETMERYRDELLRYERDLAGWKRSKADGDPPIEPDRPIADRCWCDDSTIEALAVLLMHQPRGLLMARDELAGWLGGFDRYAQARGADVAKWLEVFGGRSMLVDRKTSGTIYIPRAAVSIAGAIQPEVLRRALGVEYRENGLAARLLLTWPPRQPKRWNEADIDPIVEAAIAGIFDELYGLQSNADDDGDPFPVTIPLTPDGKAAWVDFFNAHAEEQVELTGDLSAAWSKLEGYAARLALIIHFVRWAAGDCTLRTPDAVDEASVAAGVALSRWFGLEARRVYVMMAESDEDRDQRRLVEWIQNRGGSVTARDLTRNHRAYRSTDDARAALDALVEARYGRWDYPQPGPQGGAPAKRFQLINSADIDTTPAGTIENQGSVGVGSSAGSRSQEEDEAFKAMMADLVERRQCADDFEERSMVLADDSEERAVATDDDFEERAAILQFDAGLSRDEAEAAARAEVGVA